jgi:deoxyribose-phosphate aldolase
MDPHRAQLAISLVDLTDLSDDCDVAAADRLCDRALAAGTAAVCVWPDFVAQAARRLAGAPPVVATVVNFPAGTDRPHAVRILTRAALDDGADEIDVVLPYRAFVAGDRGRAGHVLDAVRDETRDRALMKVILETGELDDEASIRAAARFAVDHGADFIKTSTGKTSRSATLEAAGAMLDVISDADRPVGLKPSGGLRSADDAEAYLSLAESKMGEGWPTPSTFRFGASGLLDALLAELGHDAESEGSATSY